MGANAKRPSGLGRRDGRAGEGQGRLWSRAQPSSFDPQEAESRLVVVADRVNDPQFRADLD